MQPTLAGFISWAISNMALPTTAITPTSANSIWFTYAYNVALAIVNKTLCAVGSGIPGDFTIYTLAVYNLAADNLINYAQDLPGGPTYGGDGGTQAALLYFANARRTFKCNDFVSGVVQSTSDEGTSVSMIVQEAAQNFTLMDLQNLKTPWGRRYLAFAQDYGPTIFGSS